jgi:hypothetical protein
MSDNYEVGKVAIGEFIDITRKLIDTSTEAVIAELVDNCIDVDPSKIFVDFYGTSWENIAIVVYDNGKGFQNEEALKNSFDLAVGDKKESTKIGKFRIGMKLTPLSKCDEIAVFTKINGNSVHRKTTWGIIEVAGKMATTTNITKYPFLDKILDEMEQNDYTTAVVLSSFITNPTNGEYSSKLIDNFALHTSNYLGIIYQEFLDGSIPDYQAPNIKIKSYSVTPKDPFWSEFTPSKVTERLEPEHPEQFDEDDFDLWKCYIPWGTISTECMPIQINIDGKTHIVKVTGYVIPKKDIRGKLPSTEIKNCWPNNEKDIKAGSNSLKAQMMSGLYFYRNKRCICFGNTGITSNKGWYRWKDTLPFNWMTPRFKIEWEDDEELDSYLKLSPTKDKVNPNKDFFDKISVALKQTIDDPLLRGTLGDGNRKFYESGKGKESKSVVYAAVQTDSPIACRHCDHFHHKKTTCHKAPCETCHIDKSEHGCDTGKCNYRCPHCNKVGDHPKEECDDNCEECDYPDGAGGHGSDPCPKCCSECGEPKDPACNCPCPGGCGEPKSKCDCLCPGGCGKTKSKCACPEDDSFIDGGEPEDDYVSLVLYQNHSDNIKYIKKAMKFLEIKISDLEDK